MNDAQAQPAAQVNFADSHPQTFPNASSPALKATAVQCEVDGGAFTLTLSDLRPIQPHSHHDRFAEGKSGFVEVGRFTLSPVAFLFLKNEIAQAEAWYVQHFGMLPDLTELSRQIKTELPEKRPEVEQRIGFRLPS